MSKIEDIRSALPQAAKDTKLNLQRVLEAPSLNPRQRGVVALACAYAIKHKALIAAIEQWADASITTGGEDTSADNVKADAVAAASLMAMNNVFYRFKHLVGDAAYDKAPSGLRMNHIAKPLTDKLTFELASIAVSAINGCGVCIESHNASIKEHGGTSEHVLDSIRIAAVTCATATAMGA